MKLLVISDVHSNLEALEAVLGDAGRYDYVVFLGDAVNYGPSPLDVLDRLRQLAPDVWLQGNHDRAVASKRAKLGVGFGYRAAAELVRRITRELLPKDELAFLKGLPRLSRLEVGSRVFILAHGSPRDPLYGCIHPWYTEKRLMRELRPGGVYLERNPGDVDAVLVGHTHTPFSRSTSAGIAVLNPGSVGQPGGGDPRASYAVLDLDSLAFEVRRVKYDVASVLRRLRSLVGDPEVYGVLETSLLTGSYADY